VIEGRLVSIKILVEFILWFIVGFNEIKLTSELFSFIMIIGGRMKRLNIFLVIVISFFLSCSQVSATTLRDLYNDLSSLEKSYKEAQNKSNMTQAELSKVKASISSTEAEIKRAQQEIIQAEKDIQTSEAEIEKKKEETNQMLLYLQLMNSNGNSMLEYIFNAEDYTEFIYRYSVVTQMSDYNNTLMDELNALVSTLQTKKTELANKQQELGKKKTSLEAQYLIVQAQYKDEHDEGLSIADQISEKKKQINHYKSLGCTMDQDVNRCNKIAAVDGWTYPLKHFYQTSNYAEVRWSNGKKVYHYAVDLGVAEGNNVYAVANGEVISSAASTCGGLVIQIKHNYNGSYYVSLYMHLIDGYVKIGDKVKGGQVIGTSGGGPREIAKWGDRCTGGPHLHFSMATGDRAIRYSSELGTTFNPVRFFPAMKGIGHSL